LTLDNEYLVGAALGSVVSVLKPTLQNRSKVLQLDSVHSPPLASAQT
jgi:hypothetical protein